MSEGQKRDSMYSDLTHPHAGDPRVDPNARKPHLKPVRKLPAEVQERKKREADALGRGFFDSELPVMPQTEVVKVDTLPSVGQEPGLRVRELSFEKGMPMFELRRDPETEAIIIPRTIEQAEDMFLGRLPMNLELKIDESCLYKGKRGGTAIARVGKSYYGAFTIALFPTTDEQGNDIDVSFLADMRYKSGKQKEAMERFMQATSKEYYYSRLPRPASRKP